MIYLKEPWNNLNSKFENSNKKHFCFTNESTSFLTFSFVAPLTGEDAVLLQLEEHVDPAEQGHSVGGCNV